MSSISNSLVSGANVTTPSSTSDPTSASSDPLGNESTFLTLLVSQLQNQDPLSPTDSNQFVAQLTSFSQLEQLIGINTSTTALAGDAAGSTAAATGSGSNATTSTTSTTGI